MSLEADVELLERLDKLFYVECGVLLEREFHLPVTKVQIVLDKGGPSIAVSRITKLLQKRNDTRDSSRLEALELRVIELERILARYDLGA